MPNIPRFGVRALFAGLLVLAVAGCGNNGPSISGEISITPELAERLRGDEVLFIIARGSAQGLPLAVQRLRGLTFPMSYYLTEADKLVPTASFEGEVTVVARIDADGKAGRAQPGDLQGSAAASVGDRNVNVVINTSVSSRSGAAAPSPAAAAPPTSPAKPSNQAERVISGEISISPELAQRLRGNEVLFIIARGNAPGPPLAVKRMQAAGFPLRFTLTEADMMVPNLAFEGRVRLIVRIDADGVAGPSQPNDMQASASVSVGDRDVKIVIDQLAGAPQRSAAPYSAGAPITGAPPAPGTSAGTRAPPGPLAAAGGPAISGRVSILPELAQHLRGNNILYLIARGALPGPPLAVQRLQVASFPVQFRLTEADKMIPTLAFEGKVTLVARVDADGAAGRPQPGDLEGRVEATVGESGVTIVIDKRY